MAGSCTEEGLRCKTPRPLSCCSCRAGSLPQHCRCCSCSSFGHQGAGALQSDTFWAHDVFGSYECPPSTSRRRLMFFCRVGKSQPLPATLFAGRAGRLGWSCVPGPQRLFCSACMRHCSAQAAGVSSTYVLSFYCSGNSRWLHGVVPVFLLVLPRATWQ